MSASTSVFDALAARARRMSDPALVTLESAGVVAALAVAWQAPESLALALPFVAVSMFGFWGVAEHFKRSHSGAQAGSTRTAVSILQLAAGATGIAAAAIVLLRIVGRAIGTFIS